jgi:predicted secreted protein
VHRRDVDRAEDKAGAAEERAITVRVQQEARVANLESRLTELSETVGTYDRLRQHDQSSMQKLRERIAQLDQENQTLQVGSNYNL